MSLASYRCYYLAMLKNLCKDRKKFSQFQIFLQIFFILLRGQESNLLPVGYEPKMQPLHFPAIYVKELIQRSGKVFTFPNLFVNFFVAIRGIEPLLGISTYTTHEMVNAPTSQYFKELIQRSGKVFIFPNIF